MRNKFAVGIFFAGMMIFGAYSNSCAEMCGGSPMPLPPAPPGVMRPRIEMGEALSPELFLWRQLIKVGINAKQADEIKEIEDGVMRDSIRMKAEVQVAMIEMKDILDKDPVDIKVAETKMRKIESLSTDIQLSHIKALDKIKSKLTAGQRMKLIEMMKMGPMMGSMMPGEHRVVE